MNNIFKKRFTVSRTISALQNLVGGGRLSQRKNRPGSIRMMDGFTLIELLVVIAIIAVIMSVGVANLITAQKQARDAARKEILNNIQSAFEQTYAATTLYPVDESDIETAFDDGVIPVDPKNSDDYVLSWNMAPDEYCVCAKLESGIGNADLATTSQCNWNQEGEYYCIQNKQ
jgi:prepilin-type N-terminal cleavage/methylation domain-containing protein